MWLIGQLVNSHDTQFRRNRIYLKMKMLVAMVTGPLTKLLTGQLQIDKNKKV